MGKNSDTKNGPKPQESRDERLKAALKANIARRKAQARARSSSEKDTGQDSADKEG